MSGTEFQLEIRMRPPLRVWGEEEAQALVLPVPALPPFGSSTRSPPYSPLAAATHRSGVQVYKGKDETVLEREMHYSAPAGTPTLPSRGAQIPHVSEMKVQAAVGGGLEPFASLFPLALPFSLALCLSVIPLLSPAFSLCPSGQLAESG